MYRIQRDGFLEGKRFFLSRLNIYDRFNLINMRDILILV